LEQLAKFNSKVNMVPKVWPDMVASCSKVETGPDIIMVFTQPGGGTIPDRWFYDQWYSPTWDRPTGGDFNSCSFYKNAKFDELVLTVRKTADEKARAQMYKDLQKMIMEDLPEVPIYVMPNILGFNNRVKGYEYRGLIAVDFWPLWIED